MCLQLVNLHNTRPSHIYIRAQPHAYESKLKPSVAFLKPVELLNQIQL